MTVFDLVKVGATAPKPGHLSSDLSCWDNHPLLNTATPGEGSLPRNVCSTGSGPQPKLSFGGWDQYSVDLIMSTIQDAFHGLTGPQVWCRRSASLERSNSKERDYCRPRDVSLILWLPHS